MSTGYRDGGISPKISYEEFKRISLGKNTTLKLEYEEDIVWLENFKEEAKGDRELPNSAKVASLK